MSSDLGSSLTSMDWLPRLRLPRGRGGRGGPGAGPPRKPPLSYTQLIAAAIASSPGGRMTLREIYAWITAQYEYYRQGAAGWKNSIRHNLSVNKCFQRIPRSGHSSGKGSYWRLEGNIPDGRISCQSVKTSRIGENNSLSTKSFPPDSQGEGSEPSQTSGSGLGSGSVPAGAPLPEGFSRTPPETAFPFPEIDFADLNLSFHSVCRSISNSGQAGSGNGVDVNGTSLHTPVLTCSPLPRSPFTLEHSPSRPISRRPETPRETSKTTGPVLPHDWMSSLDGVKAGLDVANNFDWSTIDLSQCPGQLETPISGETPLRPLDQKQFREFCFWLDRIFRDCGLIQAQASGPSPARGRRTGDGGRQGRKPESGVTVNTFPVPQRGQSVRNSINEITDEFDWDSIV